MNNQISKFPLFLQSKNERYIPQSILQFDSIFSEVKEKEEEPRQLIRLRKLSSELVNENIEEFQSTLFVKDRSGINLGECLSRLDNFCYANCVLQCLFHLQQLFDYCIQGNHIKKCQTFLRNESRFCSFCSFEFILNKTFRNDEIMQFSKKNYHRTLMENISRISTDLISGRQEDSHEFFLSFLSSLEDEYFRSETPSINKKSLIQQIFEGVLKSQLTCCVCNTSIINYENFRDISLDIEENSSINKFLENYCKKEKLTGSNQCFCKNCEKKTDFTKKYEFNKVPEILCIHLKRFRSNFTKILTPIDIDMALSIDTFEANVKVRSKFILNSIIEHSGINLERGHFNTKSRGLHQGWYLFEDDEKPDDTKVVTQQNRKVYILFYKLISTEKIYEESKLIDKKHTIEFDFPELPKKIKKGSLIIQKAQKNGIICSPEKIPIFSAVSQSNSSNSSNDSSTPETDEFTSITIKNSHEIKE